MKVALGLVFERGLVRDHLLRIPDAVLSHHSFLCNCKTNFAVVIVTDAVFLPNGVQSVSKYSRSNRGGQTQQIGLSSAFSQ